MGGYNDSIDISEGNSNYVKEMFRKKKEINPRMRELAEHFLELSDLCSVSFEKMTAKELNIFARLFENNVLYDYISMLDKVCVQMIENIKEENSLEEYNEKQNQKLITQLEAEIEEYRKKNQNLKNECQRLSDEYQDTKERYENLQNRCEELKKNAGEHQKHAEEFRKSAEDAEKEQMNMIMEMISMRDRLLLRMDMMRNLEKADENGLGLVTELLKETARFLTAREVEIIEDTGKFNSSLHMAVGTAETSDSSQVDYIAQTVRPGYRLKGQNLRIQEVIVYVKKQEE